MNRLQVAKNAIALMERRAAPALILDEAPAPAFEGPPGERRITLLDDTEIAALGTPAQLIDGILPANGLVLLVGEKGTLKTFAMLDVAAHISLGMPDWHGHALQRGPVIYVYAEGRTGILPRVEAWKAYHKTGNLGILFVPHRVTLNEPASVRDLLGALRDRLPDEPPILIIVDTFNRNFAGNENSAEDVSAFVRGCDVLREETGATVVVVHHKGHGEAERGRGSSVLDAAADTIIFVTRDEDRITLKCLKQKDAAEFQPLAMEAVSVGSSLALKQVGLAAGQLKGNRLACLRSLAESNEKGLTTDGWQKTVPDVGRSSYFNAQSWLKANAYVANHGGRWRVTDAGRLALQSNSPKGSPTVQGGLRQSSPPASGYIYTRALDEVRETA